VGEEAKMRLRKYKLVRITAVMLLLVTSHLRGQNCHATNSDRSNPPKTEPFNAKVYEGWAEIETQRFVFYVPGDFQRAQIRCLDSECLELKRQDDLIGVDVTRSAGFPVAQKEHDTYCEKYMRIGPFYAWIWNYEAGGGYQSGVYLQIPNDKSFAASISVFSKDKESVKMAEKMFRSLRLKEKKEK
jgi:hypothetical protein